MTAARARFSLRVMAGSIGLVIACTGHGSAAPRKDTAPHDLCGAAVLAAEREARLPAGLLAAIARVESARVDPASGRVISWPWTINAEGEGRFFASQAEAVAAVEELAARGVRVVDAGCMQVNLFHHPDAFSTVAQAFDPLANARYAAGFLKRLYAASGDWTVAAGHYHSTTPERAELYRARVLSAWPAGQAQVAAAIVVDDATRRQNQLAEAWAASRNEGGRIAAPPGTNPRAAGRQVDLMAQTWASRRSDAEPAPPPAVAQRRAGGRAVEAQRCGAGAAPVPGCAWPADARLALAVQ